MYDRDLGIFESAKREILTLIGSKALEADKYRYLNQLLGNTNEQEYYEELFKHYSALATIVAPPSYEFTGYNRVEYFGPEYAITVIREYLNDNVASLLFEEEQLLADHMSQLKDPTFGGVGVEL